MHNEKRPGERPRSVMVYTLVRIARVELFVNGAGALDQDWKDGGILAKLHLIHGAEVDSPQNARLMNAGGAWRLGAAGRGCSPDTD